MAKPSTDILFSLAAKAVDVQQPQKAAQQPKNPEQIPDEMSGPPPKNYSLKLNHEKGYYLKETSHAPRLSAEEQLQLEQTLIHDTLSLTPSAGLGQNK